MVLKKQTIWLLTMLTLMVVLSAYYLFTNKPADDFYTLSDINMDELNRDGMAIEGEGDYDFTFSSADADFFLSYRLEREALRAEQLEQYEKVITSEATAQVIADAKAQIDKLYDMENAVMTLESLIKAEGFEEAVVVTNTDKVNVIVKSDDTLANEQVLNIIHLVRNHLNVAGTQVSVSYR